MTGTVESTALRRLAGSLAAAAMGALLMAGSAGAAPGDGDDDSGAETADTGAPTAPSAQPEPQSAPQLSIAIDNGRTEAAAGETLTYTTTVTNLGTSSVSDLVVTQTVAEGLELVSAENEGSAQDGVVMWRIALEPSATATVRTTMTVVPTPDEQLRVASVACAKTADDAPPIVCATHSDQLPAGAAASAAAASADDEDGGVSATALVAGGAAALVVAGGAVAALRHRRS
jgi:uncharacterized repeat protein (TIGR01451 family)